MTATNTSHANDIKAIKALIQAFFDSINAADPKALQSHFFPSAGLTIIRQYVFSWNIFPCQVFSRTEWPSKSLEGQRRGRIKRKFTIVYLETDYMFSFLSMHVMASFGLF